MEYIESQLCIFPKETTKIIILYAFNLNHSIFHHKKCNMRTSLNIKRICNCMFRQMHYDECSFKIAFNNTNVVCTCDTKLPLAITCNACFKTVKQCCGFNCVFCFVCECGNGHPYIRLIADM